MLYSRGGQQQQQGQPPPPSQSWYPSSIATSGPSREPPPPRPNFGPAFNPPARHTDSRPSPGVYPPSTSGVYLPPTGVPTSSSGSYSRNPPSSNSVASLHEKSPEELTLLLNDKDAYDAFLHSLDEVRRLDKISDELRKSTLDESRNNLSKESEIAELRTQCMIIRNTELAASREKFEELDKRYREVRESCSPQSLLNQLQGAANEADEESENLHRSFLAGEIELLEFIQKYRKHRLLYHRRCLIRMAALSSITPG